MTEIPAILVRGRRRFFVAVIASGVAEAIAIGIAAFAMRDIFMALHGDALLPTLSLGQLGACALAITVFRIANRTVSERLGQTYAISIRRQLFQHFAGQTISQIQKRRAGAVSLRFVGDLSAVRNWAGRGLPFALTAAIVLPGAALTLSLINPALAGAAVLPFLGLLAVMIAAGAWLMPMHHDLRSRRARIAIKMMERVRIAPLLDGMRRTTREVTDLDAAGAELTELAVRRARMLAILRNVPEVGLAAGGIGIIWVAFSAGIPAAEVAASLAILALMMAPVRDLASVWDRYAAWRVARQKYEGVLAQPSRMRNPSKTDGGVSIAFSDVRFRGFRANLTIDAGATAIISAPSGHGKSSLLRLAAGLEQPDVGTVRFDGGDCARRTVVIGSDAPFLQGSLRRSLCLGALKRPTDEVVLEVAEAFGLDRLIDRLEGLDGRLGEGGRTLSEGEAVRVQMARAVLARPNIVIVDSPLIEIDPELTSGLAALRRRSDATILIATMPGTVLGIENLRLTFFKSELIPAQTSNQTDNKMRITDAAE